VDFDCPHLPIAPHWERNSQRIFLVRRLDAFRLETSDDFERVSPGETIWRIERGDEWLWAELGDFFARYGPACVDFRSARREELVAWAKGAIEHGDFVGLRPAPGADAADATAEERGLVRAIEGAMRGPLSHAGRRYKLVAGMDEAGFPDRDDYEVVGHDDAVRVLQAICEQATSNPPAAKLLERAVAKLSPDWRRPHSPKGLVLLRRMPVRAAAVQPAPAITPSQMRAMLEADRPLAFYARFVDDFGQPLFGFTGAFEHGDDPKCDLDFSGAGFARAGDCKGDKKAWLSFGDEANQAVVAALKERWKTVRGEADEGWKEKEEHLAEVLFQDGRLPELELVAGKKHTFMVRPPVALAHLHGMYFDPNKCFLLPTAVASLKRLVETFAAHPDSEVLIVGHTDTAGSEEWKLEVSADRADTLKAFLRDDTDAWLAWYGEGVRASKRWGEHEDLAMIDALVPDEEFGAGSHVAAYQEWHNGQAADARQEDLERTRPDGWEELAVDGILGPKTRRQLILDYMNLDGTSLPDDVPIVTYGCGEQFPLEGEDGAVAATPEDGAKVAFDRRVEVFFFAKPFGVLPPVPGVAAGQSSKQAAKAAAGDALYPEWRRRVARHYAIDTASEGFRVRLCNLDCVPYARRPFAFCLEGYPEIRGETDDGGFVVVDSPPAGAHGYVEVWPDDDLPEDSVRWDIRIATVISPATARGAAVRLANLDYYDGEPTDELTDELREAIRYFQEDSGLEVNGELDEATMAKLRGLHDCEAPVADGSGEESSE